MNELSELRKVIMIRYLALLSVVLVGVLILLNLKPQVNPWDEMAMKIKQSVKEDLLTNEIFQEMPKERFERFVDCTFKGQIDFLKKTKCLPKDPNLQTCLENQGMGVFIDNQITTCLKDFNL